LGSGIYSVPGIMLNEVGSVGLLIVFWLIAPVFAASGLMVYGEMAGFFPDRSGAEAVYLEQVSENYKCLHYYRSDKSLLQAYPNPKYLVPVTFAISSVLLSLVHTLSFGISISYFKIVFRYSATNAIILVQYAFTMFDIAITPERQTYGALVVATCAVMSMSATTSSWSKIISSNIHSRGSINKMGSSSCQLFIFLQGSFTCLVSIITDVQLYIE
jgi:hypothetical protein